MGIFNRKFGKIKGASAWIVCAVTLLLAAITLVVYSIIEHELRWTVYLSVIAASAAPFALTFFNTKFKWGVPLYTLVLFCVHITAAMYLGTAFGFYDKFLWWDLLVHALFGFISCSVLYSLYIRYVGEKANGFILVLLFLATMGIAGLWEIWEFAAGSVTGEDPLRIGESIAAGHSPVYDTMTDMLVAIVGVAVFYLTLLVKALRKKKKTAQGEDLSIK